MSAPPELDCLTCGACCRQGSDGRILVPEADPEALAAALLRCLSDAPLARKFADNGLAHVRRHFDLRHQCRSLEAIYDAVAAPAQAD